MSKWDKPAENIEGMAVVAGANREELREWLPPREDVPEEFFSWSDPWHKLASNLFFKGGDMPPVKEGIDKSDALRHIRACLASMEPEHNHKTAACAFLMSLWYTEAVWKALPDPSETPEPSPEPKFDPDSRSQQKKREKQKRKHRKN